ncbi:MAG TPA: cysteine desulfurase-like protein [Blastocatellia bacterium]|jgi:cysteine desulfurase family protein (TIGR01976 family)|nr:cysteine desulfurase-like protein [Blastocatellia bacterium]
MIDKTGQRTSVRATDEIRAHFPALERRHAGYPVAYFDGPGGTQVPRTVVEAMADYLYHHNANTHWAYPTSAETDEALEFARTVLADFLNAQPNEVAFGPNMTTLTFHLARALGYQYGPGDEIIVTELDHHANVDSWHALARERGLTVRVVKMIPETGQLDWDDLEAAINKRTKILAIGAASNALGTISDVGRAAEMAHARGALLYVDAVHYAPHALVDVRALDCDFLGCSAYKFYGPHLGVLYAKRDLLESIDFPRLAPAPNSAPEIAETGTQNHEGMMGAAAAVDFLASLAGGDTRRARLQSAFDALHARGSALARQLWEGLAPINGVKLYGPPPDARRTPTVAFTVAGYPSIEVSRALVERGIFASHGDFYAATVVARLGLAEDGLVRAGCACYTTAEECDRLIEAVRAIAGGQIL